MNTESRQPSSTERGHPLYRKIIQMGILALIIFSPLPAASVHDWSLLVIQVTVLTMIAVYVLMNRKAQGEECPISDLRWPRFLFLGLFLLILLQIIPLPIDLVKHISPHTYSFVETFSVRNSNTRFISLSLIPAYTLKEALELLTYFLLGLLIIKTVTERTQILHMFYVIVGIGIFEALYGMFELFNRNPRILFYKKTYGLDAVTGTFVNRDHLSGYLEMIIPLGIGLIISQMSSSFLTGLSWREKLLHLSEKGLAGSILVSIGIVAMSLAVVFSRSRAGIFILMLSFLLLFVLTVMFFKNIQKRHQPIRKFISAVFLIIVAISLYIGIDATIERFSLNRILQDQRPVYWKTTIKIFMEYPIFGTGLGTFGAVYPDHLETDGRRMYLVHAHNDYLEYLTELGLVGTLFLVGGIFLLIRVCYLGLKKRRNLEMKGLLLGGFVSMLCMLIHAVTDFHFHIPANTLLFSVVLSLSIVVSRHRVDNQR